MSRNESKIPEGKCVDFFAGQPVLLGQVLGGDAHRGLGQLIGQGGPHDVLQLRVGPELQK